MNIIITDSFKKDFEKIYDLNFLGNFCDLLVLKKEINLKNPYKKFKFKLNKISVRGVFVLVLEEKYFPIFITKKSNKKFGENLNYNKRNGKNFGRKIQKMNKRFGK